MTGNRRRAQLAMVWSCLAAAILLLTGAINILTAPRLNAASATWLMTAAALFTVAAWKALPPE